jgi:hypothetical protein
MVSLDKEIFEQILLVLVNLVIRNIKNLSQIQISIYMRGHSLYAHINHDLLTNEPNKLLRLGGQQISE